MEKIILDKKYIYGGGFGANWQSYERGVCVGDVRIIDRILHSASYIYPRTFKSPEVCWARVDGYHGRKSTESFEKELKEKTNGSS